MKSISVLSLLFLVIVIAPACKTGSKKTIPPPPVSVAQTQNWLQGRTLHVIQTGFYGPLTVNGQTEIEWIDTTANALPLITETVREVGNWTVALGSDASVLVTSKGNSFKGSYKIEDTPEEGETPGIRLRLTYVDPSLKFGNSEPMEVTYTYLVKGINAKELLLELPREINGKKLLGLMEIK